MFFDYCGSKIYYEIYDKTAERSPRALIFLHGWGCDNSVFASVIPMLYGKYRCVAVDFAGFGRSESPKVGMSIEMQADVVLSLCNYLEIKNFHIVAHSYGGRIAIWLAAAKNSIVISALLIAPAGIKEKSLKKRVKIKLFKLRKKLTPKSRWDRLQKYYSADYQNSNGVLKDTFNLAISYDQTFQLGRIYQNVLIVRGKTDSAITEKMVHTMQRGMKNCRVVEINGDHFAFLQSKMEFELITKDFFCL